GRTTAPGGAAGDQFNEHAAFAAPADAALPAEAIHGISAFEQFRMVTHELAITNGHALFIAFGHDDEIHRQLARHSLHRHQGVELCHLWALGVGGATTNHYFLERFLLDDAAFKRRRHPEIRL